MSRLVLLIFIVFAFAKANSQQTTATAKSTVLLYNHPASKAVESFFKDFHAQDTAALTSRFMKNASLHSIAIKGKEREATFTDVTSFIKSIGSMPSTMDWEERLTSLETIADDNVASVHTDYDFYVNGKMRHHGRNVFTLVFMDGEWKISQITDSRIL